MSQIDRRNNKESNDAQSASASASWKRVPQKFSLDDRVLAQDGNSHECNMYYLATIRECRFTEEPKNRSSGSSSSGYWKYRVHYKGWNARWDQWLEDERLLRDTEQNREFLMASNRLEGNRRNVVSVSTDARNGSDTTSNHKRKRDHVRCGSSDCSIRSKRRMGASAAYNVVCEAYEDFCELPFTLKTVLLDERDRITRLGHDVPYAYDTRCTQGGERSRPPRLVHHLPASVTIEQVLKHFCRKRSQRFSSDSTSPSEGNCNQNEGGGINATTAHGVLSARHVEGFCKGLTGLFEKALPKVLLYSQERPQYEATKRQLELSNKPLTEVYGCEFLLRLYARLPTLMQSENSSNVLLAGPLLADLLVYLQKNRQACFKGIYREPLPEEWLEVENILYGAGRAQINSDRNPATTGD